MSDIDIVLGDDEPDGDTNPAEALTDHDLGDRLNDLFPRMLTTGAFDDHDVAVIHQSIVRLQQRGDEAEPDAHGEGNVPAQQPRPLWVTLIIGAVAVGLAGVWTWAIVPLPERVSTAWAVTTLVAAFTAAAVRLNTGDRDE